jgi:hypothetical protein
MWPFKRKPAEKTYTRTSPQYLRPRSNEGFDSGGFAIGVATGIPVSPTRGISPESIIGSSMHQSHSSADTSSTSCDTGSSSSPSDSGSSSSDSGGSGGC